MAKTRTRTVDAVVDRVEIVFGAAGVGVTVWYSEQEKDDSGAVISQRSELREALTEDDLGPQERAQIVGRMSTALTKWRARRY